MFLKLALLTAWLLVTVRGDVHEHVTEAGSHCGNFTGADHDNKSVKTEHFHCTECLYPQNCLADNQCRAGTTGSTCEKCTTGNHRVGSSCIECFPVPWPVVSFGIYLLIVIGTALCHGFTDSVCTKVKLLSHFLQNVLLTLHIKIAWPENLPQIFSIVNFGLFSSNILQPECLFVSWPSMSIYYIEWVTSLCIPVFILVLGKFLDTSMEQISNPDSSKTSENNVERWEKQTTVRRLVVMVILIMYVPATLSCIRTFMCSDTIPKGAPVGYWNQFSVTRGSRIYHEMKSFSWCMKENERGCDEFFSNESSLRQHEGRHRQENTYKFDLCSHLLVLDHSTNVFLLDNDQSCNVFIFQTIHFIGSVYLVIMGLLLPPMLIFFTLRQKKWNLLYSKWRLYGPVYESYKDRYCYWEAIPLLRKLVAIIITEAYPFSAYVQTATQLGISGSYLLAIIVLRPYRSCYWVHPNLNVHILFEVVSNLVVCCIQAVGLTIVLGYYQHSSDLVAAGGICIVIVLWIVLVLAMICETTPHIDLSQVDVPESRIQPQAKRQKEMKLKFWKKSRVEQDPKVAERVNLNITNIDF